LPEQTLGRGLRRMFFGRDDVDEYVSVIGTPAFMDFVESIKGEGVLLEKRLMGSGSKPITPMVVEVDKDNPKKDIEKLDIEIPVMSPRIQREYKNLAELDVSKFSNERVKIKTFSEEEKREIVFKDVVDEKTHHTTVLTGDIEPNYQSVIGFFAQAVMRELRLFGCYDILFGKVRDFVENYMFEGSVNLSDLNLLRNLSEVEYIKLIKDEFKKAINELTVQDRGDTEIKNYIKISEARPFVVNDKSFLIPKKSVFNRIVGDSNFELAFADFLERCDDIISYAKNFQNKEANALRIEYKNAEGFIATYYPDFFVKKNDKTVFIVETKGREDEDDKIKFERLQKWCKDVNDRQSKMVYQALYIRQDEWEENKAKNFGEIVRLFSTA
jgi:type III restriction enzyme